MFGAATLDDATVAAAVAGGRSERERITRAIAPQVRLMVMARLSPSPAQLAAVEDLSQSVLLALVSGMSRLEVPTVSGLKAFVSGIVARKVADVIRGRGEPPAAMGRMASLDSTFAELSGAGPIGQFVPATGTSPLSAADRADLVCTVMAELGRLKAEYREVITLAFFDQLPTAEVARRLNISRPAASMLLIRAVKALRRNLTGSSRHGGAVHHD